LEDKVSELGDKRKLFTRCICLLLEKMLDDGYEPMLGRDGEKHMEHSLHYDGLATDVILTRDGVILDRTADHQAFGEFWESLHPDCWWGGPGIKEDGLKSDGGHYSVTYGGKK
jgi:hypothetical protein